MARVIVICLLILMLSIELVFFVRSHGAATSRDIDIPARLSHCRTQDAATSTTESVNECILETVKVSLLKEDLNAAYDVFETAYRTFPEFSAGSCHNQAHRVGDMFYYNYFLLKGRDLSRFDYPQVTTACGYGFFHGLFEHLIQDHPNPEYVTNACEYLRGRLSKDMSDIGTICYHGSGHGFVLAEADKISKDKWGDIHAFVDKPIAQCEALPVASPGERGDCKTGVFNVVLTYMEDKNYGFVYPEAHPLKYCKVLSANMHEACLFEMAQKLDRVSGFDPLRLRAVVMEADNEQDEGMAFSVGIAGIVQHLVNDGNGYDKTLNSCLKLDDKYLGICISSITHGLFDHGDPILQYKKPLAMCADARIEKSGMKKVCYDSVVVGLKRYFNPQEQAQRCKEFPADAQIYCRQ